MLDTLWHERPDTSTGQYTVRGVSFCLVSLDSFFVFLIMISKATESLISSGLITSLVPHDPGEPDPSGVGASSSNDKKTKQCYWT
uniref:Uncharacterized protein n=1 Tax=Amphimedon queenslandica TaxID=400682 RepID=A0A1X7SGD8_AMPQE